MRRCQAKTKRGKPCKAPALKGSRYCFAHEPALAPKRVEWRSAGGRRSGRKAALAEAATVRTPEEVRDILARTLEGLQRGNVDARTANAISRTCSLLLTAIHETDLARRIQELEDVLRQRET